MHCQSTKNYDASCDDCMTFSHSCKLMTLVMKHAIDLHNATLGNSGLSRIEEIFAGLKNSFDFAKFHAFDSPAVVLEQSLQSANKTPR